MARQFSSAEAKRLMEQHRSFLTRMTQAAGSLEALQEAVKAASDAMVTQEALQLLKEIPVEELNREKRGIRVKTLLTALEEHSCCLVGQRTIHIYREAVVPLYHAFFFDLTNEI